jgi:hypothetical protein
MHLLYLDDSGSPADSSQHYFVLAGISVFERQGHWLSEQLDAIAARFDQYLMRLYKAGDPQRGIIILDKSAREEAIQHLAIGFKKDGHSWGVLRNMAEVPVFLDSRNSRLVQLADLIAYAAFQKYEHGNSEFFDIIGHRFDASGGIVHGFHIADGTGQESC